MRLVGARVAPVSHVDPALVDVRTQAEHPLVSNGETSKLRMVATGSVTAGRYGLVEYHVAPHSPGAPPHFHQTFSESFYVLSGQLTVYHAGSWDPFGPGDYALVHEGGPHGFRNDGEEWASFLILFAPGIARENFFLEMAELRRSGRTLTPEEMTAFYARHDQVMVDP
jgi:quercetin dioxygenase-like cupin family protein